MNITKKIIITDTNIITDLCTAKILKEFVQLDNVYISDLVKRDEINSKTCDINQIKNIKIIASNELELIETIEIAKQKKKLSIYDILNYVIARNNNAILATGDNKLKNYAEKNGVEVIRILKIIKLMKQKKIISTKKAISACLLLKANTFTRVPDVYINELINELEKETAI